MTEKRKRRITAETVLFRTKQKRSIRHNYRNGMVSVRVNCVFRLTLRRRRVNVQTFFAKYRSDEKPVTETLNRNRSWNRYTETGIHIVADDNDERDCRRDAWTTRRVRRCFGCRSAEKIRRKRKRGETRSEWTVQRGHDGWYSDIRALGRTRKDGNR